MLTGFTAAVIPDGLVTGKDAQSDKEVKNMAQHMIHHEDGTQMHHGGIIHHFVGLCFSAPWAEELHPLQRVLVSSTGGYSLKIAEAYARDNKKVFHSVSVP